MAGQSQTVISRLALCCVLSAGAWTGVSQAGEVKMTTDQIRAFLADRKIQGNQKGVNWSQSFAGSGFTEYTEAKGSRPSSGSWRAENDQYCSVWPPSDIWSCYDMTAEGESLTFIPANGDPWPAIRLPEN